MKRALFALAILSACGSDSTTPPPGQTTPDAPANTPVTDVTANITADATWSGIVRVHNAITISSGATLTVAPGTQIQIADSASITLQGTMSVGGTKAEPVTWTGLASTYWGGLNIPSGGSLSMTYGVWTGGNIALVAGASLMLRDSQLSETSGDLLTASGGNIDIQYSWIGVATGTHDTTHCDTHFEGNGGPTITLSHSNISTAVYGMMFYTGTNLDFTYDNWFSNSIQVDVTSGVSGDFSNGWFDKNPPSGPGITATNLATSMVADAGPR
jgi:hypothetical protein